MARRHLEGRLSGQELSPQDVWDWYEFQSELIDQERIRILDQFGTGGTSLHPRYFGKTRDELIEFFDNQQDELDYAVMLNLLAAAEALLRVDYTVRVINKKKDEISKAFSELYKENGMRVGLEEQILEIWKSNSDHARKLIIGDFQGALNLRHWLAHGRYWKPKLGQDYHPQVIFNICNALVRAILGG